MDDDVYSSGLPWDVSFYKTAAKFLRMQII